MGDMDRKAAAAAYKERKVVSGVYAVRCSAMGLCWVGQAPDLSTIWSRVSFTLRHGSHPNRLLQSAWSDRRGEGFEYQELERLDEETAAAFRDRALRERVAHWIDALAAAKI
jgi:hypothetical protein